LDNEFINYLEENKITYQVVMTKADLVLPKDLARKCYIITKELENKRSAIKKVLIVSSKLDNGIDVLRTELGSVARLK